MEEEWEKGTQRETESVWERKRNEEKNRKWKTLITNRKLEFYLWVLIFSKNKNWVFDQNKKLRDVKMDLYKQK